MIHANSDTMRQWLWKDVLHNTEMYENSCFVWHMLISTVVIFVLCIIIDMLRVRFLEKTFIKCVCKIQDSFRARK